MAGGTSARLQPRGTFGLQVANRTLDGLVDLLGCHRGNRSPLVGMSWPTKTKFQTKQRERNHASHQSIALQEKYDRQHKAHVISTTEKPLHANWTCSSCCRRFGGQPCRLLKQVLFVLIQ